MSDMPENEGLREPGRRAVYGAEASHSLDARGLRCPEPLMLVRNKVREMGAGEIVEVLATDPTTTRDLANFCRFMKHEMLSTNTLQSPDEAGDSAGSVFVYLIKKGSSA